MLRIPEFFNSFRYLYIGLRLMYRPIVTTSGVMFLITGAFFCAVFNLAVFNLNVFYSLLIKGNDT